MKVVLLVLFIFGFNFSIPLIGYAEGEPVNTCFTSFFISETTADIHPAFSTLRDDPHFNEQVTLLTQSALSSLPNFNFIPLEQNQTEMAKIKTKVEPNTIFIRGLITRADIKKVEHYSIDEYVFSTNATLEFFDLISGEVFYTRTLTGQIFQEKPKGKAFSEIELQKYFQICLKGTIEALVKQIGEDYQPGMISGHIVDVLDTARVVLDLGRTQGIYQGMIFYIYDDPNKIPVGMIKTETPQERICVARILIKQGKLPERGWTVKSFGVNRLSNQKGQTRYMVVDFSAADPESLPPDFKIDQQSLGQWLHDGLSAKTDLFMLAPLLVKLDETGSVKVQEALWDAQMRYSIFGGMAQSATVGKRVFPDVMVKGVITYAEVQTYLTPGAENKILEMGVSVEFYDRKTRDFLYSYQHTGRKVEKIVKEGEKVYRNLNLEASFRDLCKEVIREAAIKIGEEYHPVPMQGQIVSAQSKDTFLIVFKKQGARVGDFFNLIQGVKKIKNLSGDQLGVLWKIYGITKLVKKNDKNEFLSKLVVSDGNTSARKGDIIRSEGKPESIIGGKLSQVNGWQVKGKVTEKYEYSLPRMTEWLHEALLTTNKFRLLPPNFRESGMTTAEAALTLGQFQARDQREIIYQGIRQPEILITGRLGLAKVEKKAGKFKDILILKVGIEITVKSAKGDTLFSKKLLGSRKIEQVKSRGEIMIGTQDLSPEFDSLTQNTINALVKKIIGEFSP